YVCAIRCAQLGLKTACVEYESSLGGTCLNVGCIPSKALLQSSEEYSKVQHELKDHGIKVDKVSLDLDTMLKRKDTIVKNLTGGGVIGLEMGSVWLRLGSKVTVIEAMDKITGGMDGELAKMLQRVLTKQGMEFNLSTKLVETKLGKDDVTAVCETPNGRVEIK